MTPPVPDEPGPGLRSDLIEALDGFYLTVRHGEHRARGQIEDPAEVARVLCATLSRIAAERSPGAAPESTLSLPAPDDSGRAFSGAHAQAQRRAGAVPALPPGAVFDPESFGRLVHRVRLDFNAAMDKPFGLLPWERRHPSQQALDIRIGETVAGYALEQNAATWDLLCPRCASFLDRAAVDRERAERAEAKLAVIAERCKQPDQLLGTQVLVDRDAILAIISSEEGDSRDG